MNVLKAVGGRIRTLGNSLRKWLIVKLGGYAEQPKIPVHRVEIGARNIVPLRVSLSLQRFDIEYRFHGDIDAAEEFMKGQLAEAFARELEPYLVLDHMMCHEFDGMVFRATLKVIDPNL